MTARDADVLQWLDGQEGAMLSLLEELVNIDSGSYDKPGVDAVGIRIAEFLAGHGIPVTTIPVEGYGDAVKASVAGSGGGNRRSCSWAIATPSSRKGSRRGGRSGSPTAAPTGPASPT